MPLKNTSYTVSLPLFQESMDDGADGMAAVEEEEEESDEGDEEDEDEMETVRWP